MYGARPNAATAAAMYRFLFAWFTIPVDVKAGVYVARYASVVKPTAELMASETTGVMPVSNSIFHCVASMEDGALRRAGRVTTVVLMFVPEVM